MEQVPRRPHREWLGLSLNLWLTFSLLALSVSLGFATLALCHVPATALAFLWAAACLAIGCLLGFLFGIPRAASDPQYDRSKAPNRPRFVANTNIEQISDWLTKLLVGAGLIEFKGAPRALDEAARYIAAGLAKDPQQFVQVAAAILIFFPAWGFLGGYLLTRMFFERAFNEDTNPNE
jgi:hypothetical protein